MRFEWDEEKNRSNIKKHGIDFSDATEIFQHPMITLLDGRNDYSEHRWIGIGMMRHHIGVVVYTERALTCSVSYPLEKRINAR